MTNPRRPAYQKPESGRAYKLAEFAEFVRTTTMSPGDIVERFERGPAVMDSSTATAFPLPPRFSTKLEERDWLKFRLAQAFRIFGK